MENRLAERVAGFGEGFLLSVRATLKEVLVGSVTSSGRRFVSIAVLCKRRLDCFLFEKSIFFINDSLSE